jgi:hypothetical protein
VEGDILLVVVVVVALGFDFTNGFHDTARGRDLDLDAGAPPTWSARSSRPRSRRRSGAACSTRIW